MSYTTLRYTVADNILTLSLNRPEQLNAFTVEMANELVDAFERASRHRRHHDLRHGYPPGFRARPHRLCV